MSLGRHLSLLSTAGVAIAIVAAQSPDTPGWQAAAGGKTSFDVASVKPGSAPRIPDFPLDNGNAKTPGGRFSTSLPLLIYIAFAYKLPPNEEQTRAMLAHLPKWSGGLFEIEARAKGNPTKDQMRLMMQSLLADRFKLAVHFETREEPDHALTSIKPGKTGPKLRPHAEGPPCPDSFTQTGRAAHWQRRVSAELRDPTVDEGKKR
jgi:bla regulator protein blaR1